MFAVYSESGWFACILPLISWSLGWTYYPPGNGFFLILFSAKRSKWLSERQSFNGFHFLYVFVYKYFLDTSFIFISCTLLGDNYVSVTTHSGNHELSYCIHLLPRTYILKQLHYSFSFSGVPISRHSAVF